MSEQRNLAASLWDNEHAALALCQGESWAVERANPAFQRMFSCEGGELLGKSLLEFMQDHGLGDMGRMLRLNEGDKPLVFQRQETVWLVSQEFVKFINSADAKPHRRLVRIQALPGCGVPQKLACLCREMEAFFNAIHDGIWVINAEGVTLAVNTAMLEMAELSESDIIGRHVSAPMQEGLYSACVTLKALESKKTVTMFDDYANGKRFLNTSTPILDDTGEVWRVIAVIRDMSSLEEMQTRLTDLEFANATYKERIEKLELAALPDFIGSSPTLRKLVQDLGRAARVDAVGLILGETGVGKTLAARAIHR